MNDSWIIGKFTNLVEKMGMLSDHDHHMLTLIEGLQKTVAMLIRRIEELEAKK